MSGMPRWSCVILCLVACDAKTDASTAKEAAPARASVDAKTDAKTDAKAESKRETKAEAKAEAKADAPPAKPIAAAAIAPTIDVATMRAVKGYAGKLVAEIAIDETSQPDLAKLARKQTETDGISKKVAPTTKGIPAGFHEGDKWIVCAPTCAIEQVTGLGFPAGDGPLAAIVAFRDEPNKDAFGIAWPGDAVPDGLRVAAAKTGEKLDTAGLAALKQALAASATTKPLLEGHELTIDHTTIQTGAFANGDRTLVSVFAATRDETGQPTDAFLSGVWTMGEGTHEYMVSQYKYPLDVRLLVDWNGDGTHDAFVATETAVFDDSSETTSLVWWADGPRTQVIAQ
jgi:hypothetical protein